MSTKLGRLVVTTSGLSSLEVWGVMTRFGAELVAGWSSKPETVVSTWTKNGVQPPGVSQVSVEDPSPHPLTVLSGWALNPALESGVGKMSMVVMFGANIDPAGHWVSYRRCLSPPTALSKSSHPVESPKPQSLQAQAPKPLAEALSFALRPHRSRSFVFVYVR